jgi:hypothetical protein
LGLAIPDDRVFVDDTNILGRVASVDGDGVTMLGLRGLPAPDES